MNRSDQLMRTILALASGALAGTTACGGRSTSPESGGDDGSASEPPGTGVSGSSGANTGGTGMSAATGGVATGGVATGGVATGGVATGGSATGGSSGGLTCDYGSPTEVCGTLDELEDYVANYPGEISVPRPEFTECPPRSAIWDPFTCCNAADQGPEVRGDLCCYGFCEPSSCCGRAFSVGAEARVAQVTRRSDWLVALGAYALPGDLDPETATVIGDLWLRDAQAEHASIASFARFTLELLALGAPANLVEKAQRAMLDEIEHAKLCFGVAAHFLQSPAGPGALELAGAEPRVTLEASAAAAVVEGCVGETSAALVASEQRARCDDPALARVLERIAEDETRHAALSFEFVAWALSVGGPATRRAVDRALDEAIERARRPVAACAPPASASTLARYGRLTPEETRLITLRALDEVVVPCGRALLGAPGAELAPSPFAPSLSA